MAALSLLSALVLMAPVRVEVTGCESHFERTALERQLRLEWPDPPEGAQVTVRCGATWELTLQATGKEPRSEPLVLPPLSADSRVRVLALIITERGRALSVDAPVVEVAPLAEPPLVPVETEPEPPPRVPAVAAVPEISVPIVSPRPASPLRAALLTARLDDEPSAPWRVGLGATSIVPFWLGPARFGPQLRVQRGFLGLSVSGTFGTKTLELGTVVPATVTAEPELTLGCVTAHWWQLCGGARGVFGYGTIGASSTLAGVTPSKIDGPMLGGAAQLGASLRLTEWLAVDLDGMIGGAWAVFATSDKVAVASLGGAFAGVQLTFTSSWGAP